MSVPFTVSNRGSPFLGVRKIWHEVTWWPTAHTAVYGWTRMNGNAIGLGPYRVGRSGFSVPAGRH